VRAGVKATHERLTTLLNHEHASLALAQRCSGVAAPTPLFSAMLNYRHSAATDMAEVIEIAEGIQVNETGADQRIAVVDPLIHRPLETAPDKLDARSAEHHFTVAPQHVLRAVETDHTTGPQADALHRRLPSKRPPLAISSPPRYT